MIYVLLTRTESHFQIQISDAGSGIEKDFLPYVFDRFRQADGTTTRKYGGLGLGLAIVRHIVELHGGAVHAKSDGEGHGSTFIVELPVKRIQSTADVTEINHQPDGLAISSGALKSLRGTRILVIEDEKDTREMLPSLLTQLDAETRVAETADEAWSTLQE